MKISQPEIPIIYNMETYKYCTIEADDIQLTAYSDGRIQLPDEIHYRDIGNIVACLLEALDYGDRLWGK